MSANPNSHAFPLGAAASNGLDRSGSSIRRTARSPQDVANIEQNTSSVQLHALPAATAESQRRVKFSDPLVSSRHERSSSRLSGHTRSHSATAGASATLDSHTARPSSSHPNPNRRSSAIQLEPVPDIADDLLRPRQRHGYDFGLIPEHSVAAPRERSSRLIDPPSGLLGNPSSAHASASLTRSSSRGHGASPTKSSSARERSTAAPLQFPGLDPTAERSIPRKPLPPSAYGAQLEDSSTCRNRTISAPLKCDSGVSPTAGGEPSNSSGSRSRGKPHEDQWTTSELPRSRTTRSIPDSPPNGDAARSSSSHNSRQLKLMVALLELAGSSGNIPDILGHCGVSAEDSLGFWNTVDAVFRLVQRNQYYPDTSTDDRPRSSTEMPSHVRRSTRRKEFEGNSQSRREYEQNTRVSLGPEQVQHLFNAFLDFLDERDVPTHAGPSNLPDESAVETSSAPSNVAVVGDVNIVSMPGVGLNRDGRLRCTMFDIGSDGGRVVCGATYSHSNEAEIRAHQETHHVPTIPRMRIVACDRCGQQYESDGMHECASASSRAQRLARFFKSTRVQN